VGEPAAAGLMNAGFDIESSGLLDGLTGEARAQRAALVPWLLDQGITVEEIRDSFAPMLLPAGRALGDDRSSVTARQISEEVGLDLGELTRFQRAGGLPQVENPDVPAFTRSDGDTAVHIRKFLDLGFDPEQMLTVVRVLTEGLSHAAEAMRSAALAAILHPGVTELEIAKTFQALVETAAPLIGPMIQDMLLVQLRHVVETEAVDARQRAEGAPLPGARPVAAAFADLVGFTRLGEELPPAELERLANRLGELARDLVAAPVRFIKTIGDAVMFVSPDTAALLDVVLALAHGAEADELLPRLRVGVAYGPAVSRAGDWFGSPVNVASRITSIARPGSVLVSGTARGQVGDDPRFRWSAAGSKRLKGITDPVEVFRVRRTATDPAQV